MGFMILELMLFHQLSEKRIHSYLGLFGMTTDIEDKPEVGSAVEEMENTEEEVVPKPISTEPEPEPPKSHYEGEPIPKGLAKQTIRHLIDKRWLAVYENPRLLTDKTHRMDQSDIFYPMRTMLYRKGYDVSDLAEREKRQKLYSYIKEYCEDTLKIKRHQIGIFAADRAVMAYQGQTYSVSFENCKQLARLGVDIICIEKEGIVEKLTPFTEGVGIALVQSQGFVSEYGIILAMEGKRTGANVMILTDFDTDGIKIAFQLEGITRIGIDFESIDQINEHLEAELNGENPFAPETPEVEPVEEEDDDESIYKPDMGDLEPELDDILDIAELIEGRNITDTWRNLKYLTQGLKRKSASNNARVPIQNTPHERQYIDYLLTTYNNEGETYLDFLAENRIELNTIMIQIGAKRFWNWLYSQIIKIFPTRKYYTRVIYVPPYKIKLPIMEELNKIVDQQIKYFIRDEAFVIVDELYQVRGLLNTDVKREQIHERLMKVVNENENLTKFSKKVARLVKSSFKMDVEFLTQK